MKSVMGVINLQANGDLIHELSDRRAVEMLPFAGRYRLIDFALSSLVNSGVLNVGVMLPAKSRSVLDHLRSSSRWPLLFADAAGRRCKASRGFKKFLLQHRFFRKQQCKICHIGKRQLCLQYRLFEDTALPSEYGRTDHNGLPYGRP